MVVFKFRSNSDSKDLLKKLKKMHKFTKELIDCVEDGIDDDEEDEDYRYDEEYEHEDNPYVRHRSSSRRYRRGM